MRPLSTSPTNPDAGEAAEAPAAGGASLPANGANGHEANGHAEPIDAPPPQQPDPAVDPLQVAAAGPGRRGVLRRRLERLRRERDAQLAALGTLVVDARRRAGSTRPEIVAKRAAAVAELDRQVMELANAVEGESARVELRVGVSGACRECGTLLATEDRFCPSCGTPTKASRPRPEAG